MKTLYIDGILLILFLSIVSCGGNDTSQTTQSTAVIMSNAREVTVEVDTVTACAVPFKSDIVSNGRVRAAEFADLYFRSSELIRDVMVHNGQRVKKGQPLARLDMFKLDAEKTRQETALARARLDMKDALIGQGYNPDDLASVPAEVMNLVRVRSGMEQAEVSYNTALREIENATLRAPFDGVVANVKGACHTMASASAPFCRVINDGEMCVEFSILEGELPMINVGEAVEINPYNGGEVHSGRVAEINPMINDNGHITVKAKLNGANGLIDGMNVRIRISHTLSNRLVVPKSAVVLRTGRQVVFTYDNGKAMWNYVTTGLENLDSYEITDGLDEGATVIYSGNENLAHESPVVLSTSK